MTRSNRPAPQASGSLLEIGGLKLTLGPVAELDLPGFTRPAQGSDGATYRVLELPGAPLPPSLERALKLPGVASAVAVESTSERTWVALRPAPALTLDRLLLHPEGLPLWSMALLESLAGLFQRVHDAGLLFRRIVPSAFGVEGTTVTLEQPELLRTADEAPLRYDDWCLAPEIALGQKGDARTDQFSLGVLAFSLATGRIPLHRDELPPPRTFQPTLPHGLPSALARATHPDPARRYESCAAFFADLRLRASPRGRAASGLTMGAASEIGRLKSQQIPVNQDTFYFGYDDSSRRGLILIADGVSTADVGSGDLASHFVRDAARAAWEGPVGEILRGHKGPMPEEWLRAALEAILEDSNARLYAYLKQPIFVGSLTPSTHPPSSTAVLGLLDADRLLIANLGDSRLYLQRDGVFEQMTVDQDLRTELLQAGRDPSSVAEENSLGALTRSVGSFFFDPEGGIATRPLKPDFLSLFLRSDDRVLVCTDGVFDCLGDDCDAIMSRELAADDAPEAIARRLCRLADEALGADNITALVLLAR